MIFGTRRFNLNGIQLYYKDKAISHVSCTKFLGVILDDKLSWNSHVNNLCNIISRNIGILRNLNYLPQSALELLYHSLISSHLSYCSMIWGFSSKKNLKRIHLLQKRAVRIISHSHYLCPSAGLFSRMNSLPVQDIVSLQTGYFMHNCFNGLLPTSLQDYFNLNANIHTYNTRNNHDFHPPLVLRTERSKASMFYQGPICYGTNYHLSLNHRSNSE